MEETNFFTHFKRQKTFDKKARTHQKIFFQINIVEYGATLSVVDAKGNTIEPNYLSYSGAVRNLLRTIEQIQDKNSFVIDWEKPADHLFLAEHQYLVDMLRRVDNIVDGAMNRLKFQKGQAFVQMQLVPIKQKSPAKGDTSSSLKKASKAWDSLIQLKAEDQTFDDFQLLTEDTALANGNIFEVLPVGEGFRNLPFFQTKVQEEDLNIFLSLFFSYLENIKLIFDGYTHVESEDKIYARPALIFEKIDEDDALFMRVGQSLPGLNVGTLEQFDLFRYAELNELEKKIVVKFIEQDPTESVINHISRLLRKHKSKKKKENREEVVMEDDLFIIPKEIASGFIYHELPNLLTDYQVFGAEKLRTYKIAAVQPSLGMNLSHGIDFLEGDVHLDFGEEKIGLFEAIAQFRKNNYIKLNDGTHALINEAYLKKLERIFRKKGKNKVEVSFFDLPLVEELIEEKVTGDTFKKSRAVFEGFNTINKKRYQLPEVNATLRPYQKAGFKWIKYLHDNKLGGCLADDMGLGKTLQTITILATIYPKEKMSSLIVMPRSLLFNWNAEIKKFAPQISTYTYYGNTRDLEAAKKANLIFTTYALMRNDIEQLKEEKFHYLILDESQNIKNIQALTTKAVMLLKSKHRLALSGTPIENNLGELYSLFRFLNPAMFGTVGQFNQNYLYPIQKNNDKEAIRQLRQKIYPFILRRLKRDVLKDLPDKIEQTLFVEMSAAQRKLYEQRRMFYKEAVDSSIASRGLQQSRFFIFQALNELRQIASTPENFSDGKIISPKRELLQDQLMDSIANGHKVLIFVNFLAAIELVSEQLASVGIEHVTMTGATRNRQALVQKFQNDSNCKAFLMTLKTGGTGLNLTAADTIFIFDPWWNVATENQAIDRAHRIGQQNKVLAYKLITEGSIEEKIVQLQEKKKELFDDIIGSDGESLKSLSEEDIDFIFK